MISTENFQKVEIVSAKALRNWLLQNHAQKESIWIVTYKKEIADKYISNDEVLDELICFGWTDGIKRKLDDKRTMQLISPRRVQHWAQSYKDRFAKLQREGRMTPAGEQPVQDSKNAGLWDFMEDVDKLIKPEDFTKALEKYPLAIVNFNKFGDSSQRFILRWIKLAKTPETRIKRIQQAAILASQNKKIPGL